MIFQTTFLRRSLRSTHAEGISSKQILLASMLTPTSYIRKEVVHGALTNGHEWMFLLAKLNDNGNGASYKKSVIVNLWFKTSPEDKFGPEVISEPFPDMIASIG